jgi:hypothetical protein
MAPGLQYMVSFVRQNMKFNDILLTDAQLFTKYQELHGLMGFAIEESPLLCKALRLALLKAFSPSQEHSVQKEYKGNLTGDVVIALEDAKKSLRWGTYGIDGKQPLQYVRLIDCATDHLRKILSGQPISELYREVIESILKDRKA